MTAEKARERVARGAAFLDKQRPGWAERINLDTLDIRQECACVLGQLEGNFWRAAVSLFNEHIGYGRRRTTAQGFFCLDAENDVLRDAWIDAITDRLTPPVSWTHRDAAVRVEG